MYGETCIGIRVHDETQPFELALALAEFFNETEGVSPIDLGYILGKSCIDSLGNGYVIYFPYADIDEE